MQRDLTGGNEPSVLNYEFSIQIQGPALCLTDKLGEFDLT